jgi:hypothetical protein
MNNSPQSNMASCNDEDVDECCICISDLQHQYHLKLECNHKIHIPCFLQYTFYEQGVFSKSVLKCPLCRSETSNIQVKDIGELIETIIDIQSDSNSILVDTSTSGGDEQPLKN